MDRTRREVPEPPAREPPEITRVEAFSDGVLAIAVTLLVLDLHSEFDKGSFAHGIRRAIAVLGVST